MGTIEEEKIDFSRHGTGIFTHSGRWVSFCDRNTVASFNITDIARSLSLQNRFLGHTAHAYSVAQHCINCVAAAADYHLIRNPHMLLNVLLHDAAEAYVGDIISPVKYLFHSALKTSRDCLSKSHLAYIPLVNKAIDLSSKALQLEQKIDQEIRSAFMLHAPTIEGAKLIKEIDNKMAVTESHWLCHKATEGEKYDMSEAFFEPMEAGVVAVQFRTIFHEFCLSRADFKE